MNSLHPKVISFLSCVFQHGFIGAKAKNIWENKLHILKGKLNNFLA